MYSGQAVDFRFRLVKNKSIDILNAIFAFAIYDSRGNYVALLKSTFDSSCDLKMLSEKKIVACKIPKLPLTKGDFYLNYSLFINNELVDQLDTAFSFQVQQGDFFGNGEIDRNASQGIYIDQEWITLDDTVN